MSGFTQQSVNVMLRYGLKPGFYQQIGFGQPGYCDQHLNDFQTSPYNLSIPQQRSLTRLHAPAKPPPVLLHHRSLVTSHTWSSNSTQHAVLETYTRSQELFGAATAAPAVR
jgi:hypothetical protein